MSDQLLRLIPTDPAWIPDEADRLRAETLFCSLVPQADEVNVRTNSDIEFVDAGSNWGSVQCPKCDSSLSEDWWTERMGTADEGAFTDLTVETPCCGLFVSLNELQYEWPIGFARFILEARNPGRDMTAEEIRLLEQALGCPLRKVWAHY